MRRGLLRDVRAAFEKARAMASDPGEEAALITTREEVLALLQENTRLRKALSAAVDMHDHCPADDDYPREYSDKVEAYKLALDKVSPYCGKR